jgi:hypothetical protein
MDSILNFVAVRRPPEHEFTPPTLADTSDLQRQLDAAAASADPPAERSQAATGFVEGTEAVTAPDQVNRGPELVALHDSLTGDSFPTIDEITTRVRAAVGDVQPSDWVDDLRRARDTVVAAYLLEQAAFDATAAVKLVRAYSIAEAVLAGDPSVDRLNALLRAPLVLPDSLTGTRLAAGPQDDEEETPDAAVDGILRRFRAAQEQHIRLTEALAEVSSHDEDELVLSELDEQRPLVDLYRTPPRDDEIQEGRKALRTDEATSTSPLRRAAMRSNVVLSEVALRLMTEPATEAIRAIGLDPATASVRDMQVQLLQNRELTGQNLRSLSGRASEHFGEIAKERQTAIAEVFGTWAVDPIDDPGTTEPVASAPPGTFTTIKPLGVADLHVVRTHIARYERGEVASLTNVLPGEKLNHMVQSLDETESTDTTDREETNLQSLAQSAAEQNAGKTVAQSIGAGRGPLTSDGPETFSKSVTDAVSSSSTNRSRRASVLRRLRRAEESHEHVLDNTGGPGPKFGVYQWLDKVYQAQVFNYGSRLLYDLIVPEPAVLFREALSRPRGQGALPPKPAAFTVPADRLSARNWSYYATGHRASGVEAPPQARIIVTEPFGKQSPDPFASELNANTLEMAETRSTRIPKGYKATQYRVVALVSGWNSYRLSVSVGTKHIAINGDWSGRVFSGRLDGEVESLPVGIIVDGNGVDPGVTTLSVGVEIVCEPTEDAIAAWQTKAHGLILAANRERFADYEERVAERDATARLQLQALTLEQKRSIIRSELKRTTLAVLTNQNFSTFNATRPDSLGFPYPDAAATVALSAYIRFFEQAVEWEHLECAFLPYFWGSRTSWVNKLLGTEGDPQFRDFLGSGAARVVLPIRPGYEKAFEKFLNTGTTPTTDDLLDVGGPLWASLVAQLRAQGAENDVETAVGKPWEFRIASDLVRARRDDLLPKWTLTGNDWAETPDANS